MHAAAVNIDADLRILNAVARNDYRAVGLIDENACRCPAAAGIGDVPDSVVTDLPRRSVAELNAILRRDGG